MKKHGWIAFAAIFVLGLFMVTANAQAIDREALKAEIKKEIKEEMKAEGGLLSGIQDRIKFSGLIEVGGVWQEIDYESNTPEPEKEDDSDLCLTTLELTVEAEINKWVNVAATLLYEDPTFGEETSVDLDVATVTIGNTEEFPLYVSVGAMYVPFGALLTHFPDDPLMNVPVTLVLGETREKALLLGMEHEGFSVSAYAFNGDMDETGEDNQVESYGFDANFSYDDGVAFDLLIGGSYISNIADSDGLEEEVGRRVTYSITATPENIEVEEKSDEIKDYIDGFDAYLHLGYADFFVDAEYMTALDEFEAGELADNKEVDPEVWNVEVGYNYDWGKNLEIVLKYAGSDEAGSLSFPEKRYGICLNQELFEDVIVSLGYLYDEYENDDVYTNKAGESGDRDTRDLVFAQIAIEF
ncbi:MAG: LbtU family siderophore porin [Desulfobacterales bacterium]|nr:LbtU family siderophore porin [Desulfobacterales bacterium]